MIERTVEYHIRKHLSNKGWISKREQKKPGEHGVDIHIWHPRWRKIMLIEVKGGSGKHAIQAKHNAFYNLLGQCISRMDREGNKPNKARIYAIGIPYAWVDTFRSKIKRMTYGWNLLRLKVFLVKKDGSILEKPYSFFLK